jgi:hypothetical protein
MGEGTKTLVNVVMKDKVGELLGQCLGKGKCDLENEITLTLEPNEIIVGAKVDTNVECQVQVQFLIYTLTEETSD